MGLNHQLPNGATPLDVDELEGLVPVHLTSRSGNKGAAEENSQGNSKHRISRSQVRIRSPAFSKSQTEALTARKDDAPAAVQAAIVNVAGLGSCSVGGGLIQTTSG